MNCLKCSHQFNIEHNIPRLLPHCGHTICQQCVKKLISSNFILCPECQQVNLAATENDLPKNLAILSVRQELQKVIRKEEGYRVKEDEKYCGAHLKEYDNFCFDCSEYGCLECLINHAKEHKVKSLQQAQFQLREHTQEMLRKTKEMKLSYRLQKIQIEKTELSSSVNSYKTQIHSLFAEMRSLCEKKEEDALSFLKSLYDIELIRLLQQQKQVKNLFDKYTQLQTINSSKTIKELIDHYITNKEIFATRQLENQENSRTKQEDKLSNQLSRWESHFNKFKDTMLKQVKQILNVKSLPVSSTIPIKLQIKTPRDQTRFYQTKANISNNVSNNSKQNTVPSTPYLNTYSNGNRTQESENIPPRIIKVDAFNLPSQKELLSNKSFTTVVYGGYTDDSQNSKMSGIEVYGSSRLYDKYVGCVGHVKFGMLEYNNQVFIFGGKVDSKRIDCIFGLPSLKEGFKIVGKLTKPKSGFGYCKLEDSFVVVGGNDGDILSNCEEYSFESFKRKRQLPALEIERDELSLTYHRGEIYAIGGYNFHSEISLKSVEMYSFESEEWSLISQLSHPRRSHCSISLPSGLFVVGGYDGINYLSGVQRLNEHTGTWDEILNLSQPRCTFSIAQHDQGFIVFGGFTKSPDKSCEVCNVKEIKSKMVGGLMCNRFMHGCVAVADTFKS